jgi:hypothetical protein
MAISVGDLQAWLDTLPEDECVHIDEGGLAICAGPDGEFYIEVGREEEIDNES